MSLRSEWEWGWNTPLLLHPVLPPDSLLPAIRDFLATPLDRLDFASGEKILSVRLAALKTSRLGIRFERIQEALFLSHPETLDLRPGIVIPQRTEIDLLHRLRTWPEGWIHWEVAVKFYLALDRHGSADSHRWVGPSLQDTLGRKLHKIQSRQLPILEDPDVRRSLGIPEAAPIESLPLMRGIFYRPHDAGGETLRPDRVRPDGARGIWIPESKLAPWLERRALAVSSSAFHVFGDRREWLRATAIGTGTPLKDYLNSPLEGAIRSHFRTNTEGQEAPAPLHGTFTAPGAAELRVFVVDDGWADRAEAMLDRMRHEGRI